MAGIYVTSTGFSKKTLSELKTELESLYRNAFGNDIDLDPSGGFGQLIGIASKREADLWDALEEIYTSRNPLQATGTSLDNIIAENGITRLAATATQAKEVLLFGDQGTVVTAGKLASQVDTNIEYALDSNVTITKTLAREGVFSIVSVTPGNTYTITIDSINYSYVAGSGDDANAILNAMKTLIDAGVWTGTTSVNAIDEQLTISLATDDFSFDTTSNISIDQVASSGNFTSTITGMYTLAANTLTIVKTPVAGWNSVNNPAPGITGRNIETDSELRIRRAQSIVTGNATEDAIRTKIFNDITGVTNVIIKSNRTNIIDIEGRPPHSFECVVVGGNDTEIATKILNTQSAGIDNFGNTITYVFDSQGVQQQIRFSRPEEKYIWVRISRNYYNEEEYPLNGDELIKSSIVNWSLNQSNINIGTDIIRQRLSTPIYEVPGIGDIIIETASTNLPTDTPVYGSVNIPIGFREIGIFSTTRITVQDIP